MYEDHAVPGVVFDVLGPLEMHGGTGGADLCGKPAMLLSLLLLSANSWVDTGQILDALWGKTPPVSANRNVKTYVWQLRRMLPPTKDGTERLQGRRGGYRIHVADDELDAAVLERTARQEWPDADPGLAADRFETALALWRGSPYPELPEQTTRVAVARLEQVRWHIREQLAEAMVGCSRYADAIALLQPLVAEDPLREGLWTQLVLAFSGAGRRGEALSSYQRARRVLLEELGVEPSPTLQGAQRRALGGEASYPDAFVAVSQPMAVPPRFLPRDLRDFVGRDAEVDALRAPAADAPQVAVIAGLPGVGKSALAVHVAHLRSAEYPDGQVFCDLHGHDPDAPPAKPVDVLAGLLQAFGVPATSIPDGLERRAGLWRSVLSDRRVLLVLDDAVNATQVAPLLPGRGGWLALVTTRRRMAGLDGSRVLELEPLPDAPALDLLAGGLADGRVAAEPDAARATVAACGNLPAAIRIAAIRLGQHPSWTVSTLAQRLERPDRHLAELRTSDRDVSELFAITYHRLRPAGQRLFRAIAAASAMGRGACPVDGPHRAPHGRCFDADEVLALAARPGEDAERTLEHLLDHHLLAQCPHGHYRMHRLLSRFGQQPAGSAPVDRSARSVGDVDSPPTARTA
jgi:DNA-binding SARP family transcriptional activator